MRSRCPYHPALEWCQQCNGGATLGFEKMIACPMCDGKGLSRDPVHMTLKKRPSCNFCNGAGRVEKLVSDRL